MTTRAFRSGVVVRLAVVVVAATACSSEKRFDPPDRAARVTDAEARYAEARFDTLTWADEEERAFLGNSVYASRCRDCHGPLGRGGTPYAANRGLVVPSLTESEWGMASSPDSVRHRVFVGHAAGMPTWGVAGISPREIDAVAFYLLERLRPEVLGGG